MIDIDKSHQLPSFSKISDNYFLKTPLNNLNTLLANIRRSG